MHINNEIQYRGIAGISQVCIDAVVELIHAGHSINCVKILTLEMSHDVIHALYLNVSFLELGIFIQSGFGSGYNGEAPRALGYTLKLLQNYCDDIDEYFIPKTFLMRLDASKLSDKDLQWLQNASPIRPQRWHDYIYHHAPKTQNIYQDFPEAIPMSIIDNRLLKLALEFNKNQSATLRNGYCLIETIIKEKSGLNKLFGAKLFDAAFNEHAIANIFKGTFAKYRNPRAHNNIEKSTKDNVQEFLLLNQLFVLESNYEFTSEVES